MTLKNAFKSALQGVNINKSRSGLTILGIVIGITAIILLMSLGKGAQNLILSQIQGLGSKTIVVMPGREPKGPTDIVQILTSSLKAKDLEALKKKENAPTISEILPIAFGAETGAYLGETYRLTIFGASPQAEKILELAPAEGTFFSDEDVLSRADTAVIGAKVKEKLFGGSEALGQFIKIKGRNFKVVGVLPKKGQVSFFNFDEVVIVPYTTAQQYIFGIKYFHRFIIEAESQEAIPRTVKDIVATIRNSHDISDPEKDDFHVETQADLAERLGVITSILTLFLVAVAAISLVVGGIGIMNIMLVSVTERTREIGLRKALGATDADVLKQFLLEAVILTGVGGIVGAILGIGFSLAASLALTRLVGFSWTFNFPLTAVLLGLGVSVAIGLIFGIYPARRAASKNPIEALRWE